MISRGFDHHMRPLDHTRDLMPVADLIEECFRDTIDPDGLEYLSYLRDVGRQEEQIPGWAIYNAHIRSRFDGYVWEVENRIIGNVTLLPTMKQGKRIYLIANVAVKEEFRGRGIGRCLTERALEGVRERKGASAWLQVREDNPLAHGLYLSMGFSERAARTTWVKETKYAQGETIADLQVGFNHHSRKDHDWPMQKSWLRNNYPDEIIWNLPFREDIFLPGIWHGLNRLLNGDWVNHQVLYEDGAIRGFITWQPTHHYYDLLWPAPDPAGGDPEMKALLQLARYGLGTRKPIAINYPAGKSDLVFLDCGFTHQATLIWMEAACDPPSIP